MFFVFSFSGFFFSVFVKKRLAKEEKISRFRSLFSFFDSRSLSLAYLKENNRVVEERDLGCAKERGVFFRS